MPQAPSCATEAGAEAQCSICECCLNGYPADVQASTGAAHSLTQICASVHTSRPRPHAHAMLTCFGSCICMVVSNQRISWCSVVSQDTHTGEAVIK